MAARKKITPEVPRFQLASDESGHNYAIPVGREEEFYAWAYADEGPDCPDYATRIDGRFTFTDPRCD